MTRFLLAVSAAGLWASSATAAIDCATEPQSRKDHWSWRIIDGKRCWYAGKPGLSKSRLRWPVAAPQSRPEPGDAPAAAAAPNGGGAVVPPREVIQSNALNEDPARELTFRERWPN